MGNAQSGPVAKSRRGPKGKAAKVKPSKPVKSVKNSAKSNKKSNKSNSKGNNKKSKKGKKRHISESEEEFSEDELLSDAGSDLGSDGELSDAESEGPSEAPSSFLGDDSDGEDENAGGQDEDDSGLASMSYNKKINFTEGMFCSFGIHSVNISAQVGTAYLERYKLTPGQKLDYDQNAHSSLFSEVQQWFPFTDEPSGSAILTSRVVNWILKGWGVESLRYENYN